MSKSFMTRGSYLCQCYDKSAECMALIFLGVLTPLALTIIFPPVGFILLVLITNSDKSIDMPRMDKFRVEWDGFKYQDIYEIPILTLLFMIFTVGSFGIFPFIVWNSIQIR